MQFLRDNQLLKTWLLVPLFFACQSPEQDQQQLSEAKEVDVDMQVAKLGETASESFKSIQQDFQTRNPGYEIDYLFSVESVPAIDQHRVLFVQEGQPTVTLTSGVESEVTVGDIIMLAPEVGLQTDSAISLLQFIVPTKFPEEIPQVIRPDWDPNITDVPGGCATETNAYRRILLTWKQEVGKYLYHDLNAHRVRIMDSFSHYHPVEGGFDEFYLVQMALPEAKIITSSKVATIERPDVISKDQVSQLLQNTDLNVGDLVYLPRGVMHRGIGGVLAQVITIPGFIPGSEIGIDHHLKAINESLDLDQTSALPYNLEASNAPLIK